AKAGSTVSIKVGDQEIGQGQADGNGTYTITIPKQTAGTTLSVTASNSAGTSAATTVTVKERLAAPTINDYYTTEAFARGMAPGASKVAIYVNGQLVRTAAVDPNGSYSIYTGDIESLRTAGNTFEIAAIDAAGTESEKTQQTVQLKLEAPTVNTYFTSAQAVTGKATGSKVNLYVNGTLVG
ncbi:TPA: Ig-like domain-containing protein, partial [Bacillus thuringiensis]